MNPQFVISCHADTGFRAHRLRVEGREVVGHLDNFAGVHAVMMAYFGGGLDLDGVRIELTPDEEIDMSGARRVLRTLAPDDVVAVVDVTGAPTRADITIEKCADPALQRFVRAALRGLSFELFAGCPDPVADADECDVYGKRLKRVFFLGIPCRGGDYNKGTVRASRRSLDTAARALVRLARAVRRGTGLPGDSR